MTKLARMEADLVGAIHRLRSREPELTPIEHAKLRSMLLNLHVIRNEGRRVSLQGSGSAFSIDTVQAYRHLGETAG
jgi:hypothetical protein